MELARQLTLIDVEYFNKINAGEFLNGKFFGKNKEKEAPNLFGKEKI